LKKRKSYRSGAVDYNQGPTVGAKSLLPFRGRKIREDPRRRKGKKELHLVEGVLLRVFQKITLQKKTVLP